MLSYLLTDDDEALIDLALREDFGPKEDLSGDETTHALVPLDSISQAKIVAKEELVVCGLSIATRVFEKLNADIHVHSLVHDGEAVKTGAILAELSGPFAAILSGERLALNFLQHLSGIATQTAKLRELIKGQKTSILDTRKTIPGLRRFEKYAVRVGGGTNHRIGLFDAFLIKNNHIDFLGGDVRKAIRLCRESGQKNLKVQVEVRNEKELRAALEEKPDALLLDNMSPEEIRHSLKVISEAGLREKLTVEASGGIQEKNLLAYAETGVDFVSLGALTHSVRASDISLRFVQ